MHPVKRIEIIANAVELGKILDGLEKAGAPAYTIIRNVAGKSPGATATELDNIFVIVYCLPDQLKPVVEKIRPILNKFGGACYITDAMEIRSTRCVASL
ncbi:putative nitrogen regulatory protein P-II [Calothrix sp. NIES-4071]|nr:putative nitrogen regulatory protein P-II [Calothrix sp. NIES-4071]BAZ61527.1 putative nitrogen regulatory protein P-II [Calothrix sp. NIES-4105]